MNGYELWRLREFGFSGIEVQRHQSEFWSKRNCPIERKKRKFGGPPGPGDSSSSASSDFCGGQINIFEESPPAQNFLPNFGDGGPVENDSSGPAGGSQNFVGRKRLKKSIFDPPSLISSSESLRESASLKMPKILQENYLPMGKINKIFSSQWLNDQKLILSTKCNNLLILDLRGHRKSSQKLKLTRIPSLKSRQIFGGLNGGMHALHLNPSKTFLATGAENPSEMAIYRLPGFEPLTVAQGAHVDWIFDLKWLDDEFLVSGSRDGSLALFKIKSDIQNQNLSNIPTVKNTNFIHKKHQQQQENYSLFKYANFNKNLDIENGPPGPPFSSFSCPNLLQNFDAVDSFADSHVTNDPIPGHVIDDPDGHVTENLAAGHVMGDPSGGHVIDDYPPSTNCIISKKFRKFDKIRALAYNYTFKVITMVTLNKRLYMVDAGTFKQVSFKWIGHHMNECVCLCHDDGNEQSLVVGSRSHFLFFDARNLSLARCVPLPNRSVAGSFAHECPSASGVRSISWHGPLVTVGTGTGEMLFYDVRASKYLDCDQNGAPMLQISDGWLDRDDVTYRDVFMNTHCPTAIYTHCYDAGGTRLFAAGGPISELLIGNYAAIWC